MFGNLGGESWISVRHSPRFFDGGFIVAKKAAKKAAAPKKAAKKAAAPKKAAKKAAKKK